MEINFAPYPIQYRALEVLWDDIHSEVFFGGAARVSKTYLSCAFAVIECLRYPGIHIGIGRSRMTYLKKTTLLTLFEFFQHQKLEDGKDFNYNKADNIITFNNGSKIIFLELYDNPSDPHFERLLSLSLTHCIIDECSQVSKKAYETLATRISYKLQEYNIKGKMLIVSNPTTGWLKDEFYKPFRAGTLDTNKAVILGTPLDNPTAGKSYIEHQLQILSEPLAQRLIYGNWDVDDDSFNVIQYDDILNAFYVSGTGNGESYISADIADKGKDSTVIIVWKGLAIVEIIMSDQWPTDVAEEKIKQLMSLYNVKVSNVVIDSDGLGVGVANKLKGCYHFKGGSTAINKENFRNLKTQIMLKMASMIAAGQVRLLEKYREQIIKELSLVRYEESDKDRIEIESKEKQKRKNNGKSPDLLDSIMMRFVFEIKKRNTVTIM